MRWLVGEAQRQQRAVARREQGAFAARAQLGRAALEDGANLGVEAPEAAKAGRGGDVDHREVGLVEELLREMDAPRAGDRERRGSELVDEEPAQVAPADAEARGEIVDPGAVEAALVDEAEGARDGGVGAEAPGRAGRGLGATAAAGPESGGLRGRRAGEESDVLPARKAGRAAGPAVNPRGGDPEDKAPFEAPVPALHGAVERFRIEVHGARR